MTATKDMTNGTPWKLILIFAIPIFLSNLFQQLYNSVDSIIVGNFLSDECLAAVSSSGNLIFLFTSFFIGTAGGAGVVISKFFGAKDYESMQRAIHTNIAFGLVASLILTIAGICFTPQILIWMNVDQEVLPYSIKYFRFYFLGATGVVMYNIFNGTLQALGNSRRPLLYLIISSCLNIILDLIFIAGFKLGVEWAAIATSISQLTSASLCLIFLMKKGTIYQVKINKVRFHKDMLELIIKYGVPSGIQNSVIAIANVFVQSNINQFGKVAMAGCGSYSKVEGFAFLPITCFNMALTTFIGQNLGAKEYQRARIGARFGILCAMILAEIIGIITYIFAPYFIGLFSSSKEVIEIGTKQARTMSLFYFLLAYSHSVAAVCRGAGKAFVPMLVMLAIWCGVRVTYIMIITHFFNDIQYIFYAYPLTWAISSLIYCLYYFLSDWIHGFDNNKKEKQALEN